MATSPFEHSVHEGYEERDANTRKLFYFVVFIAAALGLTCLVVRWTFVHFERTAEIPGAVSKPFESSRPLPPPPRLQESPDTDISNYLNSQRETLTTYGWIDRSQGIARIPIDRAMQLVLEQGLPVRNSGNHLSATRAGHLKAAKNGASTPGREENR